MTWYLITEHPVAVNSYDHIDSQIQDVDLSYNLTFNEKLRQVAPGATVLDIGCGAGSFVRTLLAEGVEAVGLEGSDIFSQRKISAWAEVPDHLFTCDVTMPFTLHQGDAQPHRFDVVTAWEFVEHIEEQDLRGVWANIRQHLRPGGLFIVSTPSNIYRPPKRRLDHHRTRKNRRWWEKTITAAGFARSIGYETYFAPDWVRRGGVQMVFTRNADG